MEALCGAWQFTHAERLDEFLVACGVNVLVRTMTARMKPLMIIRQEEGGEVSIIINTAFMVNKSTFTLGQEFEFTEPMTNQNVKATVTVEDGKMIQKQQNPADGKEVTIIRHVEDDKLIQKMYVENVECTRYFDKVSEDPSTPATPFEP